MKVFIIMMGKKIYKYYSLTFKKMEVFHPKIYKLNKIKIQLVN